MRIEMNFDFPGELKVPYKYFEQLQQLVYELLHQFPDVSWLHNEGVEFGKRSYKPLVYSHLHGARWTQKYNWVYQAPITLYVASPLPRLIEAIQKQLNNRAYYRFCGKTLASTNCKVTETQTAKSNVLVRTLSPIVVNRPIMLTNGKIYQQYVNAFEQDFNRIIKQNLENKSEAFYNVKLDSECHFEPQFTDNSYCKTYYYKGTAIKAWTGKYKFTGNTDYLHTALECGVGAKNAQGFGMIEIV